MVERKEVHARRAAKIVERAEIALPGLKLNNSRKLLRKAVSAAARAEETFLSSAGQLDGCAFFSHQSADYAFANLLRQALDLQAKARGSAFNTHPYWRFLFNGGLRDSNLHEPYVATALCLCNVVIVVATKSAVKSYYVPLEVDIALALGTPIICVSTRDVRLKEIHAGLGRAVPYRGGATPHVFDAPNAPIVIDAHGDWLSSELFGLLESDPCRPHFFGGASKLAP